MQHYPKFRRAQRLRDPYNKGTARRAPTTHFTLHVLCWSIAAASASWIATPHILRWWTLVQLRPEDIAAREASISYGGCDEVRAAGLAPLYVGEPGYRAEMDGDNDGIACEPQR